MTFLGGDYIFLFQPNFTYVNTTYRGDEALTELQI